MLSIRLADTIRGSVKRRWRTRRIKPREKLRPRGLSLWKKARLHLCWVCHMAPWWLTAQMAAWSLYIGNMRAASCKQAGPHLARRNQWSWQIVKTRSFQGHLWKAQISGPFRTRILQVTLHSEISEHTEDQHYLVHLLDGDSDAEDRGQWLWVGAQGTVASQPCP